MPSVEQATPSRRAPGTKLPHGLVTPPAPVRERIEQERARLPPEMFAKSEQRLLNEWTIGYIFDSLCLEVVYRPTPQGPEVLAVGTEEVIALKRTTPVAEQMNFETFLGYS